MAITRETAEGSLVRVEIEDVPPIRRQIYAVWRSDEPPTEVVEQFLDAFRTDR
jgi:DNA-binding transcriptional LysR family regulator